MKIFTLGHSNRSFEEFFSLLKEFGIEKVADVRRYPSSRKFPQFNRGVLEARLEREGIHYLWFEGLGGRRTAGGGGKSPNDGIDNPAFRTYADYMLTVEFFNAYLQLIDFGENTLSAIMCAEKCYGNCHRKLLSDFLKAQGIDVVHIMEEGRSKPHQYTDLAKIKEDKKVIYPSPLFQ